MRPAITLVAALLAGAALVTQPLLLRATSHLPFELRDPVFISWVLAWDARHLPHRLIRVWDTPALYPYDLTLAFSEHFLGVALFVTPVYWLVENPVLLYNVATFGSYVLAGVGMYVLARQLSFSTPAAFAAAMIYAFGPFRFAQLAHLQNLMTGWMPLVLAGLHRYFTSGSRRALAGALIAFLLLSASSLYFMLMFAVVVVPLAAIGLLVTGERSRRVRDLVLAAAAFLVLYGPVLKLYADVHARYGLTRDRETNIQLSASPFSYLHQAPELDRRVGFTPPGAPKPDGPLEVHDGRLSPGLLMLIFAGVGMAARTRSDVAWMAGGVAAAGFVLSLGPQPSMFGSASGIAGPYDLLFRFVPGFDGIRVPARFGVLVHLGLGVLAALGLDATVRRVRPRTAVRIAGVVSCLAVWQSYPGAITLVQVGPAGKLRDNGLATWLARQPRGAVAELPIGGFDRNYRGFLYHYRTLWHPHPLVGGWSGYQTDIQLLLGGPGSPLRDHGSAAATLDLLRGMGVRYLIVHPGDYPDPALGREHVERITAATGRWVDRLHFGQATAFVLAPPPVHADVSGEVVPASRFSVRASTGADRTKWLVDGLLYSRWTSGPQSGGEWIELEFERPIDVAGVRIEVHPRSFPHYPQELTITAQAEGRAETLFSGSVMDRFGRALSIEPARPVYDIRLPSNLTKTLRIQQSARTVRAWFWAVDELTVLERH